jgi:EAL domain-containing protein (putative c-di-GMP-specific phosphodiesterase class I)
VIVLARSLGMKILAEEVETFEQQNKLRVTGCTEVQDYFFNPPKPAIELSSMIERLEKIRNGNDLEAV